MLSSKEKSEFFGIEIKPWTQKFTCYFIKEPKLIGGDNKIIRLHDKVYPIFELGDFSNWIFIYKKNNSCEAKNLYIYLKKASKGFGLKLVEPEWVEIPNYNNIKDWFEAINDFMTKGNKKYSFILFLLDKNKNIYYQIKKYTLCKNSYISQVVNINSMKSKPIMSICSKILLQINAILGGNSLILELDKIIKDLNLMIIGVDYSHIKGKRTCFAYVATINKYFTKFYNKEHIIKEEYPENLQVCFGAFIEESIKIYYFYNKTNPKGIIIYRQGISLYQKYYLSLEIEQIDMACKNHIILYYYILVKKK